MHASGRKWPTAMGSSSGFEMEAERGGKAGGRKTRIEFAREVPEPVDFDDVEEQIVGRVNRRKKIFASASKPTQESLKGAAAVNAALSPLAVAVGEDPQQRQPLARQPGALSPLQGLDLGNGKPAAHTMRRDGDFGQVYGEHREGPARWIQRNLGKAGASLGAAAQALREAVAQGFGGPAGEGRGGGARRRRGDGAK